MGSGISTKRRIARELLDAAVVSNINAEAKVDTTEPVIEPIINLVCVGDPLVEVIKKKKTGLNILLVSPRRELALRSSIPLTPCGQDCHIYSYYCPLCMEFFKSILKSKCCGNYTCLKCTCEYLTAKGFQAESSNDFLGSDFLKDINCPHCFTNGFDPQLVQKDDTIRDYSQEFSKVTGTPAAATGSANPMTPLRIGDSFEDLKRKMVPFAVKKSVPSINPDGIAGGISKKLTDLSDLPEDTNRLSVSCESIAVNNAYVISNRSSISRFSLDGENHDFISDLVSTTIHGSMSDLLSTPISKASSTSFEENKSNAFHYGNNVEKNNSEYDEMIDESMISKNNHNDIEVSCSDTGSLRIILNANFLHSETNFKDKIDETDISEIQNSHSNSSEKISSLIRSSLKGCCHFIASNMIKKIIDDIIIDKGDVLNPQKDGSL